MRIYWDFTKHCNLSCRHCYNAPQREVAARDISLLEKEQLVHKLAAKYPRAIFHLLGGEPTLSPDFAPITELCSELEHAVEVTTNGFVSSPRIIDSFRYVSKVYISIDGHTPQLNDDIRGPGSFNRAIAFIRAIKSAHRKDGSSLTVSFTATSINIKNPADLVQLCVQMGVGNLTVSPMKHLGNAVNDDSPAGVTPAQYFDFVVALAKNGLGEDLSIRATGGSIRLKEYIKWNYLNDIVDVDPKCGSAINQLRISSTGDALPCASGDVSPYFKRGDWNIPLATPEASSFRISESADRVASQFRTKTIVDAPVLCSTCDYHASGKCYGGCPVKRSFFPEQLCRELKQRELQAGEL